MLVPDKGEVFVWGYGILGKGPELGSSDTPTRIPPTLFGRSELNPEVKVVDIECGLGHFVAVTGQCEILIVLDKACVGHFAC